MNQGFTSIPFKAEKYSGLAEINGIAKFSAAGIVLEFESKILGLIPGTVQEVRLALSEILDIKIKKGVFKRSAKIEIRVNSVFKLAELPNTEGKVVLKLVREDIQRGEAAVLQMQRQMTGYQDQLPPPQTPVSSLFDDQSEDETKELENK
jgi:hypothetical protein